MMKEMVSTSSLQSQFYVADNDMPPKRKGRPPSRAASSPVGKATEDVAMTEDAPLEEPKESSRSQDDPWTDEQAAALFKCMIRWKPVGPFP